MSLSNLLYIGRLHPGVGRGGAVEHMTAVAIFSPSVSPTLFISSQKLYTRIHVRVFSTLEMVNQSEGIDSTTYIQSPFLFCDPIFLGESIVQRD